MTRTPDYFNLCEYFLGDDSLTRIGHRTAIEFRGRSISYNQLRGRVDYWAERMISSGIARESRVALLLYDSPDWTASFLAAASIGAVCVPINTFLSSADVQFIIADSGARLVIVEDDLGQKLGPRTDCSVIAIDTSEDRDVAAGGSITAETAGADTTKESPAFMLYTSGSTGMPKGVLHRHGSIPYTVDSYARTVLGLSESDRTYSASRLFFAYGLGNSLSFPLAAGATAILDRERPAPEHIAALLLKQRPTVFFGVPAVFRSLLDLESSGVEIDVSSLRLCISAGEALPARVFEEWKERFGHTILDGIGSTEMLHIFMSNTPGDARAGSSGKAIEGYQVRLLDDAGNEMAGEQTGNLWVGGGSAMECYWNRPETTRETMRGGLVKTGDVYRRDAGGYYYHVGRSDDCFKVRGLWVSPIEVESALLSHDSVIEAAVVADVDENDLATGHAYLVIRQDGETADLAEQLRAHASACLPQYKVPSLIDFVGELPRTATGKVQRYKLRRSRSAPAADEATQ